MSSSYDPAKLKEVSYYSPTRIGNRIRARVVDSLIYLAAGIGLLWSAAWLVLPFFDIQFISVGVADSDPPQLSAGIRTLAIPDSDLWATIFLLYEVPLVALRGQTPGKALNNLKVVAIKDGQPPGWGRSCTRWAVLCLPLLIPFGAVLTLLIAVSPLFDPDRRGWHDKAAGTTVVNIRTGTA